MRSKLFDIEMCLYDYVEAQLSTNGDNMERVSHELHALIESVVQDVCVDNDIDDYTPQY